MWVSREEHSSLREEQGSVPGGCERPEGPAWLKGGGAKGGTWEMRSELGAGEHIYWPFKDFGAGGCSMEGYLRICLQQLPPARFQK